MNRAYLAMLMKYGIHSAIVDAFDSELIALSRGEMPEVLKLVHGMMDGDYPSPSSLSPKEMEYYKTVRVIRGDTLYSDSWLET